MSQECDVPIPNTKEGSESRIWLLTKGLVKSVAASVPLAASLGQAYSEWEEHTLGKRLDELRDNMVVEFGLLRERVDDLEKCLKESANELPGLLEVAVEKVRREVSKDKRRLYARLLCGALALGSTVPTEEKVAAIQHIETLTTQDLRFLEFFAKNDGVERHNIRPSQLGYEEDHPSFEEDMVGSITKLESRGLLTGPRSGSLVWQMAHNVKRPTNWAEGVLPSYIWLMPSGKILADILYPDDELGEVS